jgi:hypothetical protein
MKIVRDENQHNDSEKNSVVVHCWKEEFDIQNLLLICFEFRTLFDLKNKKTSTVKRCYRYLNKTMKIKFELRMLLHLCLKRNMISKLSKRFYIFERRQNFEIYQDDIVSYEKSIVNENWFQKVLAIEFIIVRMMILKQSKKKRTFFRRRKFDVLIRSI